MTEHEVCTKEYPIYPKGVGVVCIDPNGIEANTMIVEFLGTRSWLLTDVPLLPSGERKEPFLKNSNGHKICSRGRRRSKVGAFES